jgi:hypothetical protein
MFLGHAAWAEHHVMSSASPSGAHDQVGLWVLVCTAAQHT